MSECTTDPAHISSLLLRAEPKHLDRVVREIETHPVVEVALTNPNGQIIVTLETPSEAEIVDTMTRLQLIDGVVSAALVYHQMEEARSDA